MLRSGLLILLFTLQLGYLFPSSGTERKASFFSFNPSPTSVLMNDARHFAGVGKSMLLASFSFSPAEWEKVGLVVSTTAFFSMYDDIAKDIALSNQNNFNDNLFNLDKFHGDRYTFIFSLGIYGYGYLSGHSKIRKMGLHSIEAFLYAGGISYLLKLSLGRRRPYVGENNYVFKPFHQKYEFRSLTSGHVTEAFAVSTVLAKSNDNFYWKSFWYGSATMVALARIYHNKHWISDVFPSAVLGYTVASYVTNFSKAEKGKLKSLSDTGVYPLISLNRIGISWQF